MMKSKVLMIALGLALLLSLGLLGKVGCDRAELQSANDQLNKQLMQSDLELGRALTQFGDAEDYIGQLQEDIQQEIKERDALLTHYGELQIRYEKLEKQKKGMTTKIVYQDRVVEVPAELNLEPGAIYIADGQVTLRPLTSLQGRFQDYHLQIDVRVSPFPDRIDWEFDYKLVMNLEVQMVETILPSGGVNNYATVWELDENGEKVQELKITNFMVVVNKPNDSQWFWWAPHIDIGVFGGAKLIPPDVMLGGGIGFSPFGYGLTVDDLEWRVLRVSADFTGDRFGIGISPVVYNIGKWIPFVSNIWIGPHVNYLPPEGWGVGLYIGAML